MYENRLKDKISHPHVWIKEDPTYEQDGVWVTLHCAICKCWRSRRATEKEAASIGVTRGQ